MAKVGNFKIILNETESKQKYIMKGFLLNSFLFFASILRQSPLTPANGTSGYQLKAAWQASFACRKELVYFPASNWILFKSHFIGGDCC